MNRDNVYEASEKTLNWAAVQPELQWKTSEIQVKYQRLKASAPADARNKGTILT